MFLVLPNKIANFDHKRNDTTIDQLISDYKKNIGEDDMIHYDETIELNDLDRRPGVKIILDEHIKLSKNNFKNRYIHHHVFSKKFTQKK